ncbi:MAG: hypothetical protein R2857_06945 [Vampirovibrionales bacterium]
MIGTTMGINADAARTATATYDCLHRSETDAQHFRHSRYVPYRDRAFCGGQSREDWLKPPLSDKPPMAGSNHPIRRWPDPQKRQPLPRQNGVLPPRNLAKFA